MNNVIGLRLGVGRFWLSECVLARMLFLRRRDAALDLGFYVTPLGNQNPNPVIIGKIDDTSPIVGTTEPCTYATRRTSRSSLSGTKKLRSLLTLGQLTLQAQDRRTQQRSNRKRSIAHAEKSRKESIGGYAQDTNLEIDRRNRRK